MKRIHTITAAISIVLILLAGSGCDTATKWTDTAKKTLSNMGDHPVRRNIMILLDVSNSITAEQQKADVAIIEQAYKSLGNNDRLVVSTIDGGSYTNPVAVIREDFLQASTWDDLFFNEVKAELAPAERIAMAPPFTRNGELDEASGAAKVQERLDNYKTRALAKVKPKVEMTIEERKRFANATSILWAMQNLQADIEDSNDHAFKDKNITVHNYVLILSDMVEETSQVSFNKPLGILRPDAEKLLKHLYENNQIPALNGAHIICIGRAKTNVIQSEEGLQSVAEFWTAYFSKNYANGNLTAYEAIDKASRVNEWLNQWSD